MPAPVFHTMSRPTGRRKGHRTAAAARCPTFNGPEIREQPYRYRRRRNTSARIEVMPFKAYCLVKQISANPVSIPPIGLHGLGIKLRSWSGLETHRRATLSGAIPPPLKGDSGVDRVK